MPTPEADRLRILFRPRGNLLRCSCFAGTVACDRSDGAVQELAELLATAHGTRVDPSAIHNKEDLDGVSILLATVDGVPERSDQYQSSHHVRFAGHDSRGKNP